MVTSFFWRSDNGELASKGELNSIQQDPGGLLCFSRTATPLPMLVHCSLSSLGTKLKGKEMVTAFTCIFLITLSYAAVVSVPAFSFHSSALSAQIREFFGTNNDEGGSKPASQSASQEQPSMREVFARAAMLDRTVILTTLNAAWAANNTMIDLFLESFHHGEGTEALLDHLIIVCVDQKAYARCLQIHPHCIKIWTAGVDFSGEQALLSRDYIKLIWRRIEFLINVLEMNYDFVFTDTDVLWFRDPFPFLRREKHSDFQIACDRYNGRPWDVHNSPNAGFTYVRATNATIKFYKYWYEQRFRNPHWADQEVLNAIKLEDKFQRMGVNMFFLDTQYFGGFCAIRFTDMSKAFTMHATCCKGLDAKLYDLHKILDNWKEYKRHGNSSIVSEHASLSFRVPTACPQTWRKNGKTRKKGT